MSINWLVYLLQQRLPGAIEFFENALGVRRPAIGFGIEIVMIEKGEDVGDQGPNAAKVYWFSVNWKKLGWQLMSGCCCFGYV